MAASSRTGPVDLILARPAHPYTKSLIAAVPKLAPRAPRPLGAAIVLEVARLAKTYRRGGRLFGRGKLVQALDQPSFSLRRARPWGSSASRARASRPWRAA